MPVAGKGMSCSPCNIRPHLPHLPAERRMRLSFSTSDAERLGISYAACLCDSRASRGAFRLLRIRAHQLSLVEDVFLYGGSHFFLRGARRELQFRVQGEKPDKVAMST